MQELSKADRDELRTLAAAALEQASRQVFGRAPDLKNLNPGDRAEFESIREILVDDLAKLILLEEIYRPHLDWAARCMFHRADAEQAMLNAGISPGKVLTAAEVLSVHNKMRRLPGLEDDIERPPRGLTYERLIHDLIQLRSDPS